MDFLQLARTRQSIRKYQDRMVEREKIENCVKAAALAPSACNSQPWKFIIVDDSPLREQVARATWSAVVPINKFTLQAPVMVVVVAEGGNIPSRMGGKVQNKDFQEMDLAIATQHFCLQAVSEGLGTCILGWFNEKKVKKALAIPENKGIGLMISVGYPEGKTPPRKKRRELKEIMSFNRY